jgi:VIT1/CCC1 family predicted Fe2+/Mn2+ transporter
MPEKILKTYLSASDRLSEIIFGLIMAMTVIGASKVALVSGDDTINGRVIIASALGCNLAWGLVDAIMYVFSGLVDRGKYMGIIAKIHQTTDENTAIAVIDRALDSELLDNLDTADRKQLCANLFKRLSVVEAKKARVIKDDIIGAIICFFFAFSTAFLLVIPFFLPVGNLLVKIWLSRIISFAMLFVIGYAYASHTNKGKVRTAVGMVVVGVVINIVIILLGG